MSNVLLPDVLEVLEVLEAEEESSSASCSSVSPVTVRVPVVLVPLGKINMRMEPKIKHIQPRGFSALVKKERIGGGVILGLAMVEETIEGLGPYICGGRGAGAGAGVGVGAGYPAYGLGAA